MATLCKTQHARISWQSFVGQAATHRGLGHTQSVSNLPLKGSHGQKSKGGEDLDVWWNWV